MSELEKRAQRAAEMLRQTVTEALEQKRRLGHYAVIYRDGKAVRVADEQLVRPA